MFVEETNDAKRSVKKRKNKKNKKKKVPLRDAKQPTESNDELGTV